MRVGIFEFGSNKEIDEVIMDGHIPAVGDYFINDDFIRANWKSNMYIVRAVTHLVGDYVVLHVDKFNPDEEAKKVSEWENKMKEVMEKLNNGKKSEEN